MNLLPTYAPASQLYYIRVSCGSGAGVGKYNAEVDITTRDTGYRTCQEVWQRAYIGRRTARPYKLNSVNID